MGTGSFSGDENLLELEVMDAQYCECTILQMPMHSHFKMLKRVNFMLCEFYLKTG